MKKNSGKIFVILQNNSFGKIFINFLSPFKIENKHLEVESQFLFKLRKSWVAFQWLYLSSGPYNLIYFPVRNIIRRPWSLPTQLIPEISLNLLRRAESSLNFCIRCGESVKFQSISLYPQIHVKKKYSVKRESMISPSLLFLYETLQIWKLKIFPFYNNKLLISNKLITFWKVMLEKNFLENEILPQRGKTKFWPKV